MAKSLLLSKFIKEIKFKNRNPIENKVLALLEDVESNPESIIKKGTIFYRSRIYNKENQNKDEVFRGYDKEESFVPPINKTVDMRANYKYIPYLYCSNHAYLSIVEVRPRVAATVSIAKIIANEELRIFDFTKISTVNEIKQSKDNLLNELKELFAKPIKKEDDIIDYIPTQYVAEYIKNLGYDGIAYNSAIKMLTDTNESYYNLTIFNYNKCEAIASSLFEVDSVDYEIIDTMSSGWDVDNSVAKTLNSNF